MPTLRLACGYVHAPRAVWRKVCRTARRSNLPVGSSHQPEVGMNTRTIAIIALIIAVIVLVILLA
jgi:hypothetical protein